jgi:hypothetical protein
MRVENDPPVCVTQQWPEAGQWPDRQRQEERNKILRRVKFCQCVYNAGILEVFSHPQPVLDRLCKVEPESLHLTEGVVAVSAG